MKKHVITSLILLLCLSVYGQKTAEKIEGPVLAIFSVDKVFHYGKVDKKPDLRKVILIKDHIILTYVEIVNGQFVVDTVVAPIRRTESLTNEIRMFDLEVRNTAEVNRMKISIAGRKGEITFYDGQKEILLAIADKIETY